MIELKPLRAVHRRHSARHRPMQCRQSSTSIGLTAIRRPSLQRSLRGVPQFFVGAITQMFDAGSPAGSSSATRVLVTRSRLAQIDASIRLATSTIPAPARAKGLVAADCRRASIEVVDLTPSRERPRRAESPRSVR